MGVTFNIKEISRGERKTCVQVAEISKLGLLRYIGRGQSEYTTGGGMQPISEGRMDKSEMSYESFILFVIEIDYLLGQGQPSLIY